jgi:hypothetical protein
MSGRRADRGLNRKTIPAETPPAWPDCACHLKQRRQVWTGQSSELSIVFEQGASYPRRSTTGNVNAALDQFQNQRRSAPVLP